MNLFGGTAARRAREELAEQLRGTHLRLEHLETTPARGLTAPEFHDLLDPLLAGIRERADQVDVVLRTLAKAFEDMDHRMKDLLISVADGIERVDRSERRIHATVKRARKELADSGFESPGLEAEAAELRLVDGAGREGGGVPAVPPSVDGAEEGPSSIKGVSAVTLRKVRGF